MTWRGIPFEKKCDTDMKCTENFGRENSWKMDLGDGKMGIF
jgi:hypothetical protein